MCNHFAIITCFLENNYHKYILVQTSDNKELCSSSNINDIKIYCQAHNINFGAIDSSGVDYLISLFNSFKHKKL